ncbi:MAG: hypothetical protein ABW042_04170 [Phenylobacterium sp.]
MASLAEIITAVVIQSSAAAYSHLGVPVELKQPERPATVERIAARPTPAKAVRPEADADAAARRT